MTESDRSDPFTRIWRRVWKDDEFGKLSPEAKLTYVMLISAPEYNTAGLVTVAIKRWAKYTGLSVEQVHAAIGELDAARFVVFEEDDDELLIRTRMRNDTLRSGSWKNHKGALTASRKGISPRIRAALSEEILTAIDEAHITGELVDYAHETAAELRGDPCTDA
jgi:hypothetical protein